MGDASLQKVSALHEKLIEGGKILPRTRPLNTWAGFAIQKAGAGIMDLWTLADSSANWDLAARIG
jgi:hypothetical protein